MGGPITISDVLGVKYLGKWDWSPDGRFIAFIWDDGGLKDLWLVEPGRGGAKKLTAARIGTSDFAWSKAGDLYAVVDGVLTVGFSATNFRTVKTLLKGKGIGGLSLSKDGSYLAFAKGGSIWVREEDSGALTELVLPGRLQSAGHSGGYTEWSPSSKRFAFAFRDEESYHQIGVAKVSESGVDIEWRSHFARSAGGLSWLDENTLLFSQPTSSGTSADLLTLKLPKLVPGDTKKTGSAAAPPGTPKVLLHIDGTEKGSVMFASGTVSPDGTNLLLTLENDGWAHCYILNVDSKELTQVTFGECEDFAHAGDAAQWLPDGSGFLYSSNSAALDQRHIYRYSLKTGKSTKIVSLPGTNSMVNVSPDGRLAFQHCDEFRNMDIWVSGSDGENPKQVTFSMPRNWTEENQYPSEEVQFESAGGLNIHGYLMRPRALPAGERLPGVVWVHGGPVRQMRRGWHPMRSYALFHAYNQYLVQQGYVVLSVNYRGGIGYGRDFRQGLFHKMGVDDVADVVGAGNYLKGLSYVDPERVAVYGLSYGGYMTLHCLTQYPDVFKCGINIAGIWDFVQWTKWADKRYGKRVGLFKIFFGGEPELSPDLYRQGSPKTFAKNMKSPLLNVQGTADMNVDYQQMDSIIEDLVELGKDFEVAYYPNEVHTFAKRKTWMDAMPKMTAFLDKHLKR